MSFSCFNFYGEFIRAQSKARSFLSSSCSNSSSTRNSRVGMHVA